MKLRILSFILLLVTVAASLRAADFTTLSWKNDTTRLGVTFPDAYYFTESDFPYYCYPFELGTDYANRTYTVSVEYPEYQYMEIPAGMEEQVKSLPSEPVVETKLLRSSHRGILHTQFIPLVYRDGKLLRVSSFLLRMNEGTANRSLIRGTSLTLQSEEESEYATHSVLASGKWVKISIPQTGVFKLTHARLREIGFSDPSKVRLYGYGGALLGEDLKGTHPDDLCEVPMYRGTDFVLFYGQGPVSWTMNTAKTYFTRVQNFYATAGYYFLTEKEESPDPFPTIQVTATPSANVTTFSERTLHEEDAFNWAASGRELFENYNYLNGNSRNYSFNLTGITQDPVYYTITFAARSALATSVTVEANGSQVGSFTVSGYGSSNPYPNYYKAVEATYNGSWTTGSQENTILTLTHNRDAGIPGRLNYIALNYRRDLKLVGNFLTFRDLSTIGNTINYVVDGSSSSTQIWDVTTPGEYSLMQGTLSGSKYTFAGDNTTLREYVAVNTSGSFESPTIIGEVANQNLHALEQPDMVIIVPSSAQWLDHAERLAQAHREKDQMTVHVVTAAQVYNEFSSGTPDATAYRWFMKLFYDRAKKGAKSPGYLLMMGDCSYDNRMVTNTWSAFNPDDFLLCYQSKNSSVEIDSYVTDDYLGMLDVGEGTMMQYTDVMDIGVGRFPVRTVAEAKIAVDKTIAYMNNQELSPWKNSICYVADDEEGRSNNDFMEAAETLATSTEKAHPQFMVNRVYQDAFPRESTASGFTYPQATKRLLSLIDEGLLMLNYTGHGGPTGWSAEFLLTINQIREMRNEKLPLWVTATCDFCRYDDISYSAGEEAFLNSRGGAVALFTTSRVVFSGANNRLNEKFNENIFNLKDGKRLRLGDIMRLSKEPLTNDQNKLNFSLIGDPALMLGFPDHQVVLESMNGVPVSAADLKMRAGDIITLKGHIADTEGNINTDFNGLVHPTVFDRKELVTGNNHVGASTVFEYKQYSNKLFAGSDSVRNGYFEIQFPVPLDISYSDESGYINLYAASNSGVEGQGAFSDFTVGGTATGALETDSLGPDIWLYLNSPDFQSGGVVNPTPYLFAELMDEEGINTTGNGIGHDITVSIDNSPVYTYVLNDYFRLSPGGYTKGTVHYQFDPLPEGDHTLYFTAWDTKNNSSIYELPFRVESSAAPAVSELSCYPVPALTDLTFHFAHNRPGTNLILTFEVFTFTGNLVWDYTFTDQSSTGYYTYTWDLMTGGGGRLPQGIYLCRARFATEGSYETTETLKFVVAAQ